MKNFLDNGTILPHGLLSDGAHAKIAGFNKSYNNTALRVGVVVKSYAIDDFSNRTGLATEYDVVTIEQNADKGATTILYRNCLSYDGLGSIADFFEKNLRTKNAQTYNGQAVQLKGQNGAIVLLLCLDGASDKGIIVGSFPHPDRETTLKDTNPHLEGEYNGVHIVVNADGSTTLTFKGATDNNGKVTDPTQGNTEVKIEKDGSYQVDHKNITQRLDKSGVASLTATDNITNSTQKDFDVTAQNQINLTATKDFNLMANNIVAKAQGNASLACQKFDINAQSNFNIQCAELQLQAQGLANIKAPNIILDGFVNLGGAGGQPVLLLSTVMLGIGNLGIPVISTAISGYALKVTGQ